MVTTLSTLNPVTIAQPLPQSKHTTQVVGILNNPQIFFCFPIFQPLTVTFMSLPEKKKSIPSCSVMASCKFNQDIFTLQVCL